MKKFIGWLGDALEKARGRPALIKYALRRGLLAIPVLVFAIVVSILLLVSLPFAWCLNKIMTVMENE